MPFEIANKGDFFLVRFFGVVTANDLACFAVEAMIAEDAQPASMDRITDLTEVERFDVGYAEINALAARRKLRHFTKRIKSAIVTDHDDQYSLAKMFQMLNDHPQIDIRVWYSVDEAKDWLAFKSE